MSDPYPQIDHVLINVDAALDAAAKAYRALGFSLTARGHHSIGSSNHLAILGDDYIELLGYEPQNAARAAGLWGNVTGLAGLIFKTGDVVALCADLHGRGIATLTPEPTPLSRPVPLADGSAPLARFATLHIAPELTPSGRLFFCQHMTPELVWRPEWQAHANGATGIRAVTFASRDPVASAALMARIYPAARLDRVAGGLRMAAGRADVLWLTPEAVRQAYGHAAPELGDLPERKVALDLYCARLADVAQVLSANAVPATQDAKGILVGHQDAAGVALRFCAPQ